MPRTYTPDELPEIIRLIPGYDPYRDAGDRYVFDAERAARVVNAFPALLTHVEGKLAGKPFELEPWQAAIVANLFGWFDKKTGLRRYSQCMLYVPRKNGKALALDTPIPTPDGWKRMENITPGDTLFGENGKPTKVLAVSDIQYNRPCYRVTMADGTSVVADASHEWHVNDCWTKPRTETTEFLAKYVDIGNRGRNEYRYSIDNAGPLDTPEAKLSIPPYTLGAWLGDGNSNSAGITCAEKDKQILKEISNEGIRVDLRKKHPDGILIASLGSIKFRRGASIPAFADSAHPICGRGHKKIYGRHCLICERMTDYARRHGQPVPPKTRFSLQEKLRRAGLLNNKHIPRQYMRASLKQRVALIQGLMDTDGHISKRGQCTFTTTSEALRDGFVELARTLGLKPMLTTARATIDGKDCGPKYDIQFRPNNSVCPFKLNRKRARIQSDKKQSKMRSSRRKIVSIEPVESVPVKCVQVDNPSRLFLAGDGLITTHNSLLGAGIATIVFCCEHEPGMQIVSAASEQKQARLIWKMARTMIEKNSKLSDKVKFYQSSMNLRADTMANWQYWSAEAGSKHGGNIHLALMDELHQMEQELVDVATSGMGAREQPLTLFFTTSDFLRESVCNDTHKLMCDVRDGTNRNPSILPVIYEISAKELESDPDCWKKEEYWRKCNPNLGISKRLAFMESELAKAESIPAYENTFKRLQCNIRTETDARLISADKWALNDGPLSLADYEGEIPAGVGLDLAATSDLCSLCVLYDRIDGPGYAAFWRNWAPRAKAEERAKLHRADYLGWESQGHLDLTVGNETDYNVLRADIRDTLMELGAMSIMIDRRFQGAQIGQQLAEDGFEITAFGAGFGDWASPTKEFLTLIGRGEFRHGDNPLVRWCSGNVMAKENAEGLIKPDKQKSGDKIDPIVAAIMAVAQASLRENVGSVYETRGVLTV